MNLSNQSMLLQHFQIVREPPKALHTKGTMKIVFWLQRKTGGMVKIVMMSSHSEMGNPQPSS